MPAGFTLRVGDPDRFRVVYTLDGWLTQDAVESKPVGYAGYYGDLGMPENAGMLEFTLFWPATEQVAEHWLGTNYHVEITPTTPEPMPVGTRPLS